VRRSALASLTHEEREYIAYSWRFTARSAQLLPDGDWTYWLIKAGRGYGKTRTGAETVREWVARGERYVNLIGATADDARDIMVQGESGILAICPRHERPEYRPSQRKLIWPNGAESLIFTADEPERLRGKQHSKLWADELAAWRYADAWDQAKFGLRLGAKPQAIITTTPRPTKIVREIMADPAMITTNGSTYDNRANLAPSFFSAVLAKYEGTRLGRQEIAGEVLDDNPGALWKRDDIDQHRVVAAPALRRIVVAIDPAAKSKVGSDDTGIVVAGVADIENVTHGFVLDDKTLSLAKPEQWAAEAVAAYHRWKADRIIAEGNNGGEMVESVIRAKDGNVPVTIVTATRGKEIRAEPVSALYEQGRVHHVGSLAPLEDELCEWDPQDKTAASPNRLDALVWAITALMLENDGTAILDYYRQQADRLKAKET
jgi:phage terminase large subunit-like protein